MLRLEKGSKKLDVTLRQRERIFTRPLLQALAIALSIHFIGFILFPIALTRFSGSQQVHPPVSVAAILPSLSDVSIAITDEDFAPRYLPAPKNGTLPLPPPSSLQLAALEFHPSQEQDNFLNDFLDHRPSFSAPFTIHISGPLAASSRLPSEPLKPLNVTQTGRVVFHVQLENRSGKIFWLERKEAHADEQLNQLAEQLIQSLLFEPVPEAFVTEGEVEIIFSL